MTTPITRFAPSPTGHLHLGHAYSALQVQRFAEKTGAQILLRIEDVDQTRCRPEYEIAILDDLRWLGFSWHGDIRRQSDHFGEYRMALQKLRDWGLIYRCFRTRKEIAAEFSGRPFVGEALPESEEAARLKAGDAFAWRLSLDATRQHLGQSFAQLTYTLQSDSGCREHPATPGQLGDVVLSRKDTPAAYHLAVCNDDALQGITHIIRGEDLAEAVHIHTLLQAVFGWPRPIYHHHRLLLGPDGKRLSKAHASKSLASLRAEGLTRGDVYAMAGL